MSLAVAVRASYQGTQPNLAEILARAQQAQLEKDFSRAAQEYREASRLQPSPEIYEKLGLAYFLENSYVDAIDAFSAALRLAPDRWASQLFSGMSLYRTGRFQAALPHIIRALEINPKGNDARYWLGLTHHALGDYQQAVAQLLTALNNEPENVDILYALTEAYLDFSTTLLKPVESRPLDTERRESLDRQLAKDLASTGTSETWEQAVRRLQDLGSRYAVALQSPQTDREGAYTLSRIYAELAQVMARRLWSLKPDSYRSHQLLGEAYEAKENYEGALAEFRDALRLAPATPGLHYSIGHAYWKMKRFDEAVPELEKELALNSHNASANYVLGHIYLYLDRRQPDTAARYLQRAVEAKPDFVEARKQWGKALSLLNNDQKALEELELAAEADPQDDSVHYLLATIYKKIGLPDKAQRELETFNHLHQQKHHHDKPAEPPD